jgi:alkanesulfonate monooxygenase SsuD/methylene tetrahydromethanopterin reductase-like flavin-dependent oxidoreductase (luciferase family)
VVGTGFTARRVRHERFRDALEIIRLLWRGGYRSYEGKYLQLEDARVFDLPDEPPVIAVAASGRNQPGSPRSSATACSPPRPMASW